MIRGGWEELFRTRAMEKVRFAVLVLAGRREDEVVSADGEEGKSPDEMDWMSASFSVSGVSSGSW